MQRHSQLWLLYAHSTHFILWEIKELMLHNMRFLLLMSFLEVPWTRSFSASSPSSTILCRTYCKVCPLHAKRAISGIFGDEPLKGRWEETVHNFRKIEVHEAKSFIRLPTSVTSLKETNMISQYLQTLKIFSIGLLMNRHNTFSVYPPAQRKDSELQISRRTPINKGREIKHPNA